MRSLPEPQSRRRLGAPGLPHPFAPVVVGRALRPGMRQRFMALLGVPEQVEPSPEPDPDEHRTSNVEHRTSKGACASSLAFGVGCSVLGVRCSFSFRFMAREQVQKEQGASPEPVAGPPGFGVRRRCGALYRGEAMECSRARWGGLEAHLGTKRRRSAALHDAGAPRVMPRRFMGPEQVRKEQVASHEPCHAEPSGKSGRRIVEDEGDRLGRKTRAKDEGSLPLIFSPNL